MTNSQAVKRLPLRDEIPEEDTWRLEDIFTSDEAWEQEFAEVKALLPGMKDFQGRLGESAQTLYAALQYRDRLTMRLGKLYVYARMRYDQDTTNSFYQAQFDRARSLYKAAAQLAAIVEYQHCQLAQGFSRKWPASLCSSCKMAPARACCRLNGLLAEAEVLGASQQTFSMLNNADLEFPVITDEQGKQWKLPTVNLFALWKAQTGGYDGMLFRLFIKPTASFAILLPAL